VNGARLSPREQQLLVRIADGLTDKEIAADLKVSVESVKKTAQRMRVKLGAGNRAHAVAVGFRRRLIA
jgi:DNA-binding CsgD family transcriptional regulator